jgi:2-oxoglutarate ferredoxin oxidoreductase subunit gamma
VAGRTEIRFGGAGGQGVILAARTLGEAVVREGRNAVQTQTYGAEARGSLTKSEVIVSESEIGFPAVRKSDVLVTMSQESTDALLQDLKDTGMLIVDSTNVAKVPEIRARVVRLPATETAKKTFGDGLYANMIMLGAVVELTGLVSRESLEEVIGEKLTKTRAKTNVEAFRRGLELVQAQSTH